MIGGLDLISAGIVRFINLKELCLSMDDSQWNAVPYVGLQRGGLESAHHEAGHNLPAMGFP